MLSTDLSSTGVRPDPSYGNPLDQFRYIYALDSITGKTVLDIASGVGWGSYLMGSAGGIVTGIDVDQGAIDFSSKYYKHDNLSFEVRDSSTLHQLNVLFDVITSFETLEHIQAPDIFLRDLRSVSKSNTRLYLSTPNSILFGSENSKPSNPHHIREYSRTELESLLLNSGWKVERYLGQYSVPSLGSEVPAYQKFIKNYWDQKRQREKYGKIFSIYNRVLKSSSYSAKDPAWNSPHVQSVPKGYEPAYHYLILSPLA